MSKRMQRVSAGSATPHRANPRVGLKLICGNHIDSILRSLLRIQKTTREELVIVVWNFETYLSTLDFLNDCVCHFAGTDSSWVIAVGLHIIGYVFSLSNYRRDGIFEFVRQVCFTYVP